MSVSPCKEDVVPVKHVEGTSSQFKGVSWNKGTGKWTAKCKETRLGYHATEEAAARAGAYTRPLVSST